MKIRAEINETEMSKTMKQKPAFFFFFAKINKIYQLTKKKERRQNLPIALINRVFNYGPCRHQKKNNRML